MLLLSLPCSVASFAPVGITRFNIAATTVLCNLNVVYSLDDNLMVIFNFGLAFFRRTSIQRQTAMDNLVLNNGTLRCLCRNNFISLRYIWLDRDGWRVTSLLFGKRLPPPPHPWNRCYYREPLLQIWMLQVFGDPLSGDVLVDIHWKCLATVVW